MSLTGRVVRPISGRAGFSSSVADPAGGPWDFAIAGHLFRSAASKEMPYRRQTAQFRKEQQDAEQEPGEQSLTGWWLRSQESFHGGSGIVYQESRVATDPSNRFRESMGVDVWTPGKVSMLPDTAVLKTAASTSLMVRGLDGANAVVFQASGTALWRIDSAGSATSVTWGGAGTILDLEIIGSSYYATDSTGTYKGTTAGGAGAKYVDSGGTAPFVREAGGFILLLAGGKAYDITTIGGGTTLPGAFFTPKEATFAWTAACRGPGDVRGAGRLGDSTSIWKFVPTISSTGWTFTQSSGLPRGETVLSMVNYYNTFLALGTTKGLRLAAVTETGYTFGPLTYEGGRVPGVAVVGRYVYAAAENGLAGGLSGLVRVDPETELDSGHFAWANDLSTGTTGVMGSVTDLNGRPAFCIASGSYVAHATNKVATGYLTTGRIRYRTLESKLFKYVRVRTDALAGTLAVEALLDSETYSPIVTYNTAGSTNLEEGALPQVIGPQESMALRFTFTRAADPTTGPALRSYQIKALPAPSRQRTLQVPLMVYDTEVGYGQVSSSDSDARITALEDAEEANDLVLFQDFRLGRSHLVAIDEITYIETTPPGVTSKSGGVAYITLRTAT